MQLFHPEHYGLHGSYRNMLTESMINVKINMWSDTQIIIITMLHERPI